jgi:hypothetical protein
VAKRRLILPLARYQIQTCKLASTSTEHSWLRRSVLLITEELNSVLFHMSDMVSALRSRVGAMQIIYDQRSSRKFNEF